MLLLLKDNDTTGWLGARLCWLAHVSANHESRIDY